VHRNTDSASSAIGTLHTLLAALLLPLSIRRDLSALSRNWKEVLLQSSRAVDGRLISNFRGSS